MGEHIDSVTIDQRFCGPRNSGNGGYSAGLFARVIDGPAEVMLKAPPPLETPIEIQKSDDGFVAVSGGATIASMRPAKIAVDPPPLPDDTGIAAAHDAFLDDAGGHHMLPHCFVCGNKREPGDGLRLFTGAAPESPVNADYWTPSADLANQEGLVHPEFIWAALDCPGAFCLCAMDCGSPFLAEFLWTSNGDRKPAERLIVAAWRTGQDGRKHFSASALYDEDRSN